MLSEKQAWGIFLFEFKMCHKAVETTCNINNAFGPRTANEHTVRWWLKEFCNGDESLEDKEHRGGHQKLTTTERIIELTTGQLMGSLTGPLTTEMRSCPRTRSQPFYGHLASEANWKCEKAQKVDASWADHKSKKYRQSKVSSSLILHNNKPFLDQIVTCAEKWILYDNRWPAAQWLDCKEAPKDFPKPNLHQIKVMVTVWWSAVGLIHDSFLNRGKTITAEKYA